jgi:hypothetical protein
VLKSLDILIGLVVVLLALSMAVTLITQVLTAAVNSRGRHLRRGLIDLLQQLDPALTGAVSHQLATALLMHPLVSGSRSFVDPPAGSSADQPSFIARVRRMIGGNRVGNVVLREEFTKLLLGLAVDGNGRQLTPAVGNALKTALHNNGIADPAATLKNIRTVALQLERANPDLSNTLRQNAAILQEARSDLVAKINGWFDQTMDRTSQRFTASTRVITFAASVIVAVGLQVDTPSLVNRFAADDQLRAAFVNEAKALAATDPSSGTDPDEIAGKYQSVLATNGIIRLPSRSGWLSSLRDANPFGLLITALLLSLGAPFWYSALARLLRLRSVLAGKDDLQRTARQVEAAPNAAVTSGRPVAASGISERGDLAAVG